MVAVDEKATECMKKLWPRWIDGARNPCVDHDGGQLDTMTSLRLEDKVIDTYTT